ncbi:MAG TPA: hypothetical protein PKH97_04855 [Tetrasphaera sp.]|uniref:hypothetical protein n=1 Tax=Nostocoides sp. TaxID=1917966 RepID=UPI002B99F758|nr:hypothetical protein [Tetrasphaera sp.]HNQ06499.1 hypothetical protein [Tetrasphaera sp.]
MLIRIDHKDLARADGLASNRRVELVRVSERAGAKRVRIGRVQRRPRGLGSQPEVGLGPGDPVTGVAGTEPVGLCNWLSAKALAAFGGSGTPATTGRASTYHDKTPKADSRTCGMDAGSQLVVYASRWTYGDKAGLDDALQRNRPKGATTPSTTPTTPTGRLFRASVTAPGRRSASRR